MFFQTYTVHLDDHKLIFDLMSYIKIIQRGVKLLRQLDSQLLEFLISEFMAVDTK